MPNSWFHNEDGHGSPAHKKREAVEWKHRRNFDYAGSRRQEKEADRRASKFYEENLQFPKKNRRASLARNAKQLSIEEEDEKDLIDADFHLSAPNYHFSPSSFGPKFGTVTDKKTLDEKRVARDRLINRIHGLEGLAADPTGDSRPSAFENPAVPLIDKSRLFPPLRQKAVPLLVTARSPSNSNSSSYSPSNSPSRHREIAGGSSQLFLQNNNQMRSVSREPQQQEQQEQQQPQRNELRITFSQNIDDDVDVDGLTATEQEQPFTTTTSSTKNNTSTTTARSNPTNFLLASPRSGGAAGLGESQNSSRLPSSRANPVAALAASASAVGNNNSASSSSCSLFARFTPLPPISVDVDETNHLHLQPPLPSPRDSLDLLFQNVRQTLKHAPVASSSSSSSHHHHHHNHHNNNHHNNNHLSSSSAGNNNPNLPKWDQLSFSNPGSAAGGGAGSVRQSGGGMALDNNSSNLGSRRQSFAMTARGGGGGTSGGNTPAVHGLNATTSLSITLANSLPNLNASLASGGNFTSRSTGGGPGSFRSHSIATSSGHHPLLKKGNVLKVTIGSSASSMNH